MELGISRIPLRDALKRLAVDGLIELRKSKPAIVSVFTDQDVMEIMELRRLLESHGIDSFSSANQQFVIQKMKGKIEFQLCAVNSENSIKFINLDQEFHGLLVHNRQNKRLKEIIKNINCSESRVFLLLTDTAVDSAKKAYEEHLSILQAIEQGEVQKAKQQLSVHLDQIERGLLKYISQEEL